MPCAASQASGPHIALIAMNSDLSNISTADCKIIAESLDTLLHRDLKIQSLSQTSQSTATHSSGRNTCLAKTRMQSLTTQLIFLNTRISNLKLIAIHELGDNINQAFMQHTRCLEDIASLIRNIMENAPLCNQDYKITDNFTQHQLVCLQLTNINLKQIKKATIRHIDSIVNKFTAWATRKQIEYMVIRHNGPNRYGLLQVWTLPGLIPSAVEVEYERALFNIRFEGAHVYNGVTFKSCNLSRLENLLVADAINEIDERFSTFDDIVYGKVTRDLDMPQIQRYKEAVRELIENSTALAKTPIATTLNLLRMLIPNARFSPEFIDLLEQAPVLSDQLESSDVLLDQLRSGLIELGLDQPAPL